MSRCTFDQDSIFLIGSMSIVYGLCKRGGGSSNVHVVLKGGSSKCSCPFTRGREGVKIVPNPVHVVCERPHILNQCVMLQFCRRLNQLRTYIIRNILN